MSVDRLRERYAELQAYVGWTSEDAGRVAAIGGALEPYLAGLIDDFYDEIDRHPDARKVITGGRDQIERLKSTLIRWVRELLGGTYDPAYVERRWRVGCRHVEIGLDQVFTNVALSRLRAGLIEAIYRVWTGDPETLRLTVQSVNRLLDLDLAVIEDAYQSEYFQRIQRSERLATLGQVAGGVAHELRNPLNVVKTSVYYLLHARNPTPEKKAEHLHRIERHVELADAVITALSNFAKTPVPNLLPVSVDWLVRETLEVNPLGTGIEVIQSLPAGLPQVLCDADQLQIVLGNLIRNARDAMPSGGTLRIEAAAEDSFVEVSVADDGVGIKPEDLARLTEPLFSTKARGLGLGLAIARSILDKNQGSLRVESSYGHGSRFTVRLNAARAPGAEAS